MTFERRSDFAAWFARLCIAGLLALAAVMAGPARAAIGAAEPAKGRMAIVIGIGAYVNAQAIRNPVGDARLVGASLEKAGFTVQTVTDVNRAQLLAALRSFADKSAGAEAVAFYYAGHAVQINGLNYLLAVDAKPESEASVAQEGVDLEFVISTLSRSARTAIFFLDSCRDNPFLQRTGTRAAVVVNDGTGGLAPVNAGIGTFIGYATAPGDVAQDGVEHGPFAEAISRVDMQKHKSLLDFYIAVTKEVYARTGGRQRPWFNASLFEQFCLVAPCDQAPPVALPRYAVEIQDEALIKKLAGNSITLPSGKTAALSEGRLQAMGPNDINSGGVDLKPGLNEILLNGIKFWTWYENQRLSLVAKPYRKSYAVLFVLSKYPKRLTQQGYPELPLLDKDVERLRKALVDYDIPASNIDVIADGEVTKARIESELERFWDGGDRADADRVIVYFGGHGNAVESALSDANRQGSLGYFVTADFDPHRSAASGFVFEDIKAKHFYLMRPKHVAFFIDACASGLAVRSLAGPDNVADLETFPRLARLYEEVSGPTRNMMVAGTDRKAVYYSDEIGAYFTHFLADALTDPKADFNSDRILTFDEIYMYVKEKTVPEAKKTFRSQVPQRLSSSDRNVVFVKGAFGD